MEKILARHPKEWKAFQAGGDISGGPLFAELYEYFVNHAEMPYGVMKARTGDPDVWISNYLEKYLDKRK